MHISSPRPAQKAAIAFWQAVLEMELLEMLKACLLQPSVLAGPAASTAGPGGGEWGWGWGSRALVANLIHVWAKATPHGPLSTLSLSFAQELDIILPSSPQWFYWIFAWREWPSPLVHPRFGKCLQCEGKWIQIGKRREDAAGKPSVAQRAGTHAGVIRRSILLSDWLIATPTGGGKESRVMTR